MRRRLECSTWSPACEDAAPLFIPYIYQYLTYPVSNHTQIRRYTFLGAIEQTRAKCEVDNMNG